LLNAVFAIKIDWHSWFFLLKKNYLSMHFNAKHPNIRFLCVRWVTKLNFFFFFQITLFIQGDSGNVDTRVGLVYRHFVDNEAQACQRGCLSSNEGPS